MKTYTELRRELSAARTEADAHAHELADALPRLAETEAALVGLREAAGGMPCATCRGRGVYERACTLCGDSTYDHNCNDEERPCTAPGCAKLRTALANSASLGARIIAEAVERGRAEERATAESRGARAMLRIVERRLRYVADETYGPHAVGLRLAVAEMTPLGMDVVLNGIVERDAREGGAK